MALSSRTPRVPLLAGFGARRIALIAMICAAIGGGLPAPVAGGGWLATTIPPTAAEQGSEAARVVAIAVDQLRDRWQYAAIGPNRFDCSGLIFYAFREAGLLDRIGGKRRGATGYKNWFISQGLRTGADITKAQAGDILIWSGGRHAGIYIGDGWAISTLVNPYGVRIHRWDRINQRLTDVLHVQISREAPVG